MFGLIVLSSKRLLWKAPSIYFPPNYSRKCSFITHFLNSKWQLRIEPATHLFQHSLPLFQRFLITRFMKSRKLLLSILNIYFFFPFLHIALLELRRRLVNIFRISLLYPFFSNFHQHLPELNTKKSLIFLSPFFPLSFSKHLRYAFVERKKTNKHYHHFSLFPFLFSVVLHYVLLEPKNTTKHLQHLSPSLVLFSIFLRYALLELKNTTKVLQHLSPSLIFFSIFLPSIFKIYFGSPFSFQSFLVTLFLNSGRLLDIYWNVANGLNSAKKKNRWLRDVFWWWSKSGARGFRQGCHAGPTSHASLV